MTHGIPIPPPIETDLDCTRGSVGDIEAVLPLVREFYHEFGFPWDDERKRRLLRTFVSAPAAGGLWVLRHRREPVGYALVVFYPSLEFDGQVALLDELHVTAARRNQGWGGWFLSRVLAALEAGGHSVVRLELDDQHAGAAGLYARYGFKPGGRQLWTRRGAG